MSNLLGPISPHIPQCVGMDFAVMYGRIAQFYQRSVAYAAWFGEAATFFELASFFADDASLMEADIWMSAFLIRADQIGATVKDRDRIDRYLDTVRQHLKANNQALPK